jgi:hypothetical protein
VWKFNDRVRYLLHAPCGGVKSLPRTDGRQASVDQEFRQAQAAMKRNLNPLLVPENSSAIAEYREEKVVQVIHPLQYKRVS